MTATVLTSLNRRKMVGKLTALMEEKFEDFKPCKAEFLEAVNSLKIELGEAPVNKMLDALERRCEADILFAGNLGYQANLDNFRNPAARTFLDMDFDDYLKVNVVARMPQRSEAEREIEEFYCLLDDEQKVIFEAISSYMIYLELSLTKLAHYKGFMFANEILPYAEPGYSCNCILTFAYKRFINMWFGVEIDPTVRPTNIKEHIKITNENSEEE